MKAKIEPLYRYPENYSISRVFDFKKLNKLFCSQDALSLFGDTGKSLPGICVGRLACRLLHAGMHDEMYKGRA